MYTVRKYKGYCYKFNIIFSVVPHLLGKLTLYLIHTRSLCIMDTLFLYLITLSPIPQEKLLSYYFEISKIVKFCEIPNYKGQGTGC